MSDSPRIPLLERDQVPPEIQAIYDKLLAERGVIPYMFKTLAHTPALALGFAAFLKPLLGDGALTAAYNELIATRVASLHYCDYCVSSHLYLAALRGAAPEQIAAVNDYESGPFTAKERLGFRCADRLHASAHSLDDLFYSQLQQHFSNEEILELVAVSAAFEFFPRFTTSLRIPVTPLPAN